MFYVLLATLPVLLVLSALASGSETALFSLNSVDREELARRSPSAARAVVRLLSAPRMLLILVLVVNMTVNVLYFVVSSVLTIRAPNPLAATGVSIASVLAIILFGEVFAKIVAGSNAVRVSQRIALPLLGLRRALYPMLLAIDRYAVGPLARLLHPEPAVGGVRHEEVTALLEQAHDALTPAEQQVLREVVELQNRRVKDVMTPRVDLRHVGSDWEPGDALPGGQEFVPATADGLHRQVSFSIDARRALVGRTRTCRVPAMFIPEQARLDQLLRELARQGAEHAYCVDEHGEIQGMVRIEDVIDELVSGVGTTHAESVMLVGLGVWRVPGRMPAHDFAELFNVPEVEEQSRDGGFSTVAGLVLALLGRVPDEGERTRIGRFELVVTTMNARAIEEVEVRALERQRGISHG